MKVDNDVLDPRDPLPPLEDDDFTPKPKPRTVVVSFRLTLAERDALSDMAEEFGTSASDLARQIIHKATRTRQRCAF